MKIFWDTNLFIYLWEQKSFVKELAGLTAFIEDEGHVVATSTLTLGEILVHHCRSGRPDLVGKYQEAMQRLVLIPFDTQAAVCFAKLRALNPALRPPDGIQLACAITNGCDLFLTNDNRLANVQAASLKIRSLHAWAEEHG